MKIAGGCISGGGVIGTGIVVFAIRFAIAVAKLTGLDYIILTKRCAVRIIKAIAAWSAATIITDTAGDTDI